MAKTKQEKKETIEKINKGLKEQKAMFFINFQGMKANQLFKLRKELREAKSLLYVIKKNLIKRAFQEKKIPVDVNQLSGQIAIVFALEKELLPLKIIYNYWQKQKSPEILGGFLENEFLKKEKTAELAQLPAKEELLVRLVSAMHFSGYKLCYVLKANIKGLTMALNAISKSQ